MRIHSGKIFLAGAALLVTFASLSWADRKHDLNGTWVLSPTRSDFGGEPALQTGTVTINYREHNIYVSRNFNYDSANQSTSYSFTTDGHQSQTIHDGKTFRIKAKWDGDILLVNTTGDQLVASERYSIGPDGMLILVVERPGHPPKTLYFQRQ